ncbi:MAG: TolC family protein, partial [Myxococcota bacterium]
PRPVAPAGLDEDLPDPARSLDEALETALEERPELDALRAQRDAAAARQREVRLEYIPRLSAGVALQYTTERVVNTDWIVLGTVGLSVTPIASGTRRARIDAQQALSTQASLEQDAAGRAISVQVRQAWAEWETARQAVVIQRGNVRVAQDNARIQTERLKFGTANVVDLVEADALVRQASARLAVAKIDVVRAKARVLVAMGRRTW